MAFAPPFQRPFSATFDRRAAAAAVSNGLLNNLIAYWPLNEASGANNALDLHTNGLTLTQMSSPGADTGKVYSTARTFNGSSNYFYRSVDEALLSAGDTDFTFAAWIYTTTLMPTWQIILGKRSTIQNEYEIGLSKSSGDKVYFAVSADKTTWVTDFVVSSQGITVDTWTLVIAWHSAADDQLGIQISGNVPATKTYASGVSDGTALFQIGQDELTGSSRWYGRIGPVAMWKSAGGAGGVLSSSQRSALWNAGNGLAYANFTT